MLDPLAELAESLDGPPPTGSGLVVKETDDLIRIRNMPRRAWEQDPTLDAIIEGLNKWLHHTPTQCTPKPCSCCRKVRGLKPSQAAALKEAYAIKHGAVLPFRVGGGKTLASLLIGTVLGAKRPLLVVPGKGRLKEKTIREARDYALHWRCAPVEVVTYEFLANPANLHWLELYAPDLIVCDESQKIKAASSKAGKRIGKYLKKCIVDGRLPEPKIRVDKGTWPDGRTPWFGCASYFLSGSLSSRKIGDYWHYTRWALRSRAPLPKDPFEAGLWGKATDEKVPPADRPDVGALLTLGKYDPDAEPIVQARQAFSDRFLSTPGVVSTLEDVPQVGLQMSAHALVMPPEVVSVLDEMRRTNFTPMGDPIKQAWDMWKHSRSIGAGLFYRWDPPAPLAWREARREWLTYVRERLRYLHERFDSEVHVREAVIKGELHDEGRWDAWSRIEPTFIPNPVEVFVHDHTLKFCADWLESKENLHGLVWTEYHPFGVELSRMTGVPFFSKGGCNPAGVPLDRYQGGPAIASINCREGLNLQGDSGWHFSRNLFSVVPPVGDQLEQAIGRTHRDGQVEDEVTVEFVLTTKESYRCLDQCFKDARRDEQMHRQPKKLCYAEIIDPLLESIRNQDIDLESAGY